MRYNFLRGSTTVDSSNVSRSVVVLTNLTSVMSTSFT